MKIYVIAHKQFLVPAGLPSIYQPLQVGSALSCADFGYLKDNTGDNISSKNGSYNELTGLYWIWKNSPDNITGLCHYRRYFVTPQAKMLNIINGSRSGFLQESDITRMLSQHDIIVHNRTFFMQGVRHQFEQTQSASNLSILENVVSTSGQQYKDAFNKVMHRKYIHLLNMFIAKKSVLDSYASWLFPVLENAEHEILKANPSANMSRSIGMLAERLLDVWITANDVDTGECFSINTERIDRTPW